MGQVVFPGEHVQVRQDELGVQFFDQRQVTLHRPFEVKGIFRLRRGGRVDSPAKTMQAPVAAATQPLWWEMASNPYKGDLLRLWGATDSWKKIGRMVPPTRIFPLLLHQLRRLSNGS